MTAAILLPSAVIMLGVASFLHSKQIRSLLDRVSKLESRKERR